MKKTVIAIFLLLASAASVQARDLTQIYVRIGTGDDDLRNDSTLSLTIGRKGGSDIEIPLVQGRRLADRTTFSRVYPVEERVPLNQITRVTLNWRYGRGNASEGQGSDQWWMTDFLLTVGSGPGDISFKEAIENDSTSLSASGLDPTVEVNATPISLPHKFVVADENIVLYAATAARRCTADRDCSDRVFCNGIERCEPSNPLADARGCMVSAAPACPSGLCDETRQMCTQSCVDNDGDGFLSAACGGNDCDDNDGARFPGNVEVFGDNDKDQDCDPNTHGFFSGNTASIQVCDGRDKVVIVSKRGNEELFSRGSCITGTVCVQQPNGSGVCMTEPPRYQAPSAAVLPSGPQRMPARSGDLTIDRSLVTPANNSGNQAAPRVPTVPLTPRSPNDN